MNSVLKKLLLVLLILILLLVATAVALPFIIDPNDYKGQLSGVVKKHTGRELHIPGDIRWAFFPWLGLELGEMSLGNAGGFEPADFARIQAAEVRVKVLPLLRGQLELGRITLDGLQLNLQINPAGVSNWADLVPQAEAPTPEPTEPSALDLTPLAALAIAGLDLNQARVIWDDRLNQQYFALSPLNLRVGEVNFDAPIPINADFQFESREPAASGAVDLGLRLLLNLDTQLVSIERLKLASRVNSELIPGGRLSSNLSSPLLRVDLAQDNAQAEQLLLEALGVKLRTSFNAAALSTAPRFNASLILEPFSPRDLARQLAIELPEMADSKALNNASMSATIAGDLNQISVNDLLLQLDDTELRGQLALKDFAAPAITYQLEISQIDVDRYLPPPSETPAEPVVASPATALAAEAALIPVEPLRELNLDGTLRVMRLSAMNLKAHDIRVTTRAANGRIRLHPIGAQLYDGNYSGDIQLDATGEVLRIRLNESLNGVQIGPLLKDFMGNDIIQGRANLSAQLETRGADPQAMVAALNGTAGFDFKDGAVKGFNLARYERELSARLQGEPVPRDDAPLTTDFAHLYGSVTLTNGVARNNDLTANLPFARVRGEGEANLVNETVDYTARLRFTSRAEGQGSVTYEELTDRVALPIRIQGALAEPTITVDYNYVLRELAARELRKQQEALQEKADERIQQEQQKLDQRIEQEKQKLKDELEQKAGERLKRLLR